MISPDIHSPSLAQAVELLHSGGYTCVFVKDGKTDTSIERGIKPLMQRLDGQVELSGASVADKVVGRGAAFLYVLLGVKEIYADVVSKPAANVLSKFGISLTYGTLTEAIRNRTNTGFCPVESAVLCTDSPKEAYEIIKRFLSQNS